MGFPAGVKDLSPQWDQLMPALGEGGRRCVDGEPWKGTRFAARGGYEPLEERPGMLFWMKAAEKKRVKLTKELFVRIKR